MGLQVQGDALNAAFARFKELADRKVQLTEADLEAIVAEELGQDLQDAWTLEFSECQGGSATTPNARIVIGRGEERIEAASEGDGMIDAICKCLKEATGVQGTLTDYDVRSVTGGVDALADVTLQFTSEDGVSVSGRGLSTDVVEASARAFLSAIKRVVRVRASGEDRRAADRPGSLRML
jgi:2-isopropylmalate synthase